MHQVPRRAGIGRLVGALGGAGVEDVRVLRIHGQGGHAALLVQRPVERMGPGVAAVGALEDPDPVRATGQAHGKAAERVLVAVHLAGADVDRVRVVGRDGDRAHAEHREAGVDDVPCVGSHAAGERPPESPRGGARPQRLQILRIQHHGQGAAADVVRADRVPARPALVRGSPGESGARRLVLGGVADVRDHAPGIGAGPRPVIQRSQGATRPLEPGRLFHRRGEGQEGEDASEGEKEEYGPWGEVVRKTGPREHER